MDSLAERIEVALGAMSATGPRHLTAYLRKPAPDFDEASDEDLRLMLDMLLATSPNDVTHLRFVNLLRTWDNAKGDKWTNETPRNTEARRERIHELLKTDEAIKTRIEAQLPFYRIDEPLIIAQEHVDWYSPKIGIRDYYWSTYARYLRERKGWQGASLTSLDNSTRAVVECLSNPESHSAYSSRGIVVGHVQSGKTANFAGVIARAADTGYRLIIVLAGTWNILRNQTQRRLDKELLGKELLENDENYRDPPPPDWDEFLEHGFDPVERGHYKWERLTRPDIDFKRLKQAIDNLEFEKRDKSQPLYSAINLHSLPVKLLVIKKHSGILANLVKDLKLLATKLEHLPTLIIDDESDQAGLNTIDPKRNPNSKERTKTNERIVELLRIFARGQYVGYTATPYANALVDPDDPEDLFPKDFFVALDRPAEYMGVSDFFDPAIDFVDLDKSDYSLKEIAFIRRVESPLDQDDGDLKAALRSFVLAGAIKLFRETVAPDRYRFRHHTMLVHTSARTAVHSSLKDRVRILWDQCAFNCPAGLKDLQNLFESEFCLVSTHHGSSDVLPAKFEELLPHLSEVLQRIESGEHILLVNSDSAAAPDFGAAPVWKIIIGGNKLSRGYTIEGLTTSYYRRVTTAADTLMQMGRWFGFRIGYRDLVRVFLGVNDGPKGNSDLVALFKDVCLMEERFRTEITRYVHRPGGPRITPRELPPLISVVGQLPPTASNKMFNAIIKSRNFGGRWSQPTMVAARSGAKRNIEVMSRLLSTAGSLGRMILGGIDSDGKKTSVDAFAYEVTNDMLVAYLKDFHWLETLYKQHERPQDIGLQLEFLQKQKHGISSWIVLLPQRQQSFGQPLKIDGVGAFTTKERTRLQDGNGGFKVFGEKTHRDVAEFLTAFRRTASVASTLASPNPDTIKLKCRTRGVVLLYPVRESQGAEVAIGYEILFPENDLGYDVNFTVQQPAREANITVTPI